MIVDVKVLSKDVDAALAAYKIAAENGARGLFMYTNHHYDTNEFLDIILDFSIDHTSPVFSHLDSGSFVNQL